LLGQIFGHKRGGHVGRKFESGASKKERNVEMEKKNKELNGSLLKFLARNENACYSNKGFGGNEGGQPAKIRYDSSEEEVSRTTEGVCFSGIKQPTYVKKISSIITEETVKLNYLLPLNGDPGEWIIPMSDSQRCSIVIKGPARPYLSDEHYSKDDSKPRFSNFH
jgi:hypothetical protein